MTEKIKVCSACGHPSIMKMGNMGTLTGEGVSTKAFTASSCVHCHRLFGWSPEPPSLEYGKHYIWVTYEGVRTGNGPRIGNDPDQQWSGSATIQSRWREFHRLFYLHEELSLPVVQA